MSLEKCYQWILKKKTKNLIPKGLGPQRTLDNRVYRSRPKWGLCEGRWPGGVFQTRLNGRAHDLVPAFPEGWFPTPHGDRCFLVSQWRPDQASFAARMATVSHPVSLEVSNIAVVSSSIEWFQRKFRILGKVKCFISILAPTEYHHDTVKKH